MLFDISYMTALLGGLLTLLPACGPFVLPAFFALACKEKTKLVASVGIFFLGFLIVFIPLGLGITALVHFFITNTAVIHTIAGLLLITIGLMTFWNIKFPWFSEFSLAPKGSDPLSILIFGMTFGIVTGSCTAPTIGAVLTVVIATGVGLKSILLLLTYALGLMLPLIFLAIFYDRIPEEKKQWFFRKKILNRPLTNVIAAALFTLIGIIYMTPALQLSMQRLFDTIGLSAMLTTTYTSLKTITQSISPLTQAIFFAGLILIIVFIIRWSQKKR